MRGGSPNVADANFRVQLGHKIVLRTKVRTAAIQAAERLASDSKNRTTTVQVLDGDGKVIWIRKRGEK